MFSDVTAENFHVTPAAKLNDSPGWDDVLLNYKHRNWNTGSLASYWCTGWLVIHLVLVILH